MDRFTSNDTSIKSYQRRPRADNKQEYTINLIYDKILNVKLFLAQATLKHSLNIKFHLIIH